MRNQHLRNHLNVIQMCNTLVTMLQNSIFYNQMHFETSNYVEYHLRSLNVYVNERYFESIS